MRKPLLALGLAASTGFGLVPVANVLAANSPNSPHSGSLSPQAAAPTSTTSGATAHTSRRANAVSGAAIVAEAYKYLGDSYSYTGASPATGFSCIGFVSYVLHQLGIPLPGDLGDALAYAPQVPFSNLLPGDLLYFQRTLPGWPGLSHVGIYIGNGQFIHSEWFGKGVRVSSFKGDPDDGDYWIAHYLGANRPWAGPVVAPPAPPSAGAASSTATATTQKLPSTVVSQKLPNGPTAIVSVPSLNVRASASKSSQVQTVIVQGTTVTVLAHRGGWVKVALSDGTVGWIVAAGIGANGSSSTTVNVPYAPTRQGQVTQPARKPTVKAKVNGLRVHSSPSLGAPVVTSVGQGQRMTVIARSGNWVKVRLRDGTVGWVSAAYATHKRPATSTANANTTVAKIVTTSHAHGGSTAKVAMNVRARPSLNGQVSTVIMPGGTYHIVGWFNGWAHVRLPNGMSGWVSGSVLGKPSTGVSNTYANTHVKRATTRSRSGSGTSVITAGVRVHTRPGVNAPVVTLAAPGTHVRVLGSRSGWTLIRLPNGTTGYVLGSYVR